MTHFLTRFNARKRPEFLRRRHLFQNWMHRKFPRQIADAGRKKEAARSELVKAHSLRMDAVMTEERLELLEPKSL